MKKLALATLICATAVGAFAQGTLVFNNRVASSVITHVYSPQTADNTVQQTGNGPTDFPAGTTTYTGTALQGTGYSAQLWAAAGANQVEASLAAVPSTITTFRTTVATAGWINGLTATIPGVGENGIATLQLRAWDNAGGTKLTWADAIIKGGSPLFNSQPLGGAITPSPNMLNMVSFSLVNTASVPEPSTIALGVIGAAALLFRRRK